jgi:hypothetical protein
MIAAPRDGCGANAINCGNSDAGKVCGLNAPGKCGSVLQQKIQLPAVSD